MSNGDTYWVEHRAAVLPFRAQTLELPPETLRSFIDCGDAASSFLWRLDWSQLGAPERAWIEGGEYLPALAFHWLDRAAGLMRLCEQHRLAAAILEVPTARLTQLSISDLMHVMSRDVWLADAQVAVLWGLPHEALTQRHSAHRPLRCRGAVFPSGDGLNVGWWTLPEDIALVESLLG